MVGPAHPHGWALAPDRGAGDYQTGSLATRMAFGRLRGPRAQDLKSSGGVVYSVQSMLPEAGGQSPGRVLGVTPSGPLCEGRPACEFAGLHFSSDFVCSGGVQFLPGKKTT